MTNKIKNAIRSALVGCFFIISLGCSALAENAGVLTRDFNQICLQSMPDKAKAKTLFGQLGYENVPVGAIPQIDQVRSSGEIMLIRVLPREEGLIIGSLVSTIDDNLGPANGCSLRTFNVKVSDVLREVKSLLGNVEPNFDEVIGGRHLVMYDIEVFGKGGMLTISPFRLGDSGTLLTLFVEDS